jgi:Flp pilus assembly protein TadD
MKVWIVVLTTLLVAGCASGPRLAPPEPLFADARFAAPAEPVSLQRAFELTPAMERYLNEEIAAQVRRRGPRLGLVDALYTKGQLRLDYDATTTNDAGQAFASRSGNCLSLVIMTAAFAERLNVPVEFNHVFVEEEWNRSGGLLVSSGHVNLTLGQRRTELNPSIERVASVTIDFLPSADVARQRSRTVPVSTILAMFGNNRAAEALAAGRVDEAYWWARAAVTHEPTFMPAYNTLAVVYLRHGDLALAETVLDQVLAREPANTSAMANLVRTYERQGRAEAALKLGQQLARIEPTAPFHYFNLGLEALRRGDNVAAREHFTKEVRRAAYYHEFHFGLALANAGLGDVREARRQLALALETSTTLRDRQLYAGKLEKLKLQ